MTNSTNNTLMVANTVDALIENRRIWEEGTYAASNAELYTLLGSTLDLFLKVRKDRGLSKAVTDLLDTYKVAYNSQTSLALRIVRLIFVGTGRETIIATRAYTYARVLRVAAERGVTGETLPQFITDNNGIDEIRRQGADGQSPAVLAQKSREYAESALHNQAQLMSVDMLAVLQPVDGAYYSLALVRKNADGSASVVFGTNNAAAVNTVLSIAGKTLKQKAAQAAEHNVAKQDAEQRAENVAQLVSGIAAAQVPARASITEAELTPA